MATKKYVPNFKKYSINSTQIQSEIKSEKSIEILESGISCAESFYSLFEKEKASRKQQGGYTTNAEQDLLRSMLVFSTATLDIAVKQTIRDLLRPRENSSINARNEFKDFVKRSISKDEKNDLLSDLLIADQIKENLIERYIYELTGSSLQSIEEIYKAAKALDISLGISKEDRSELKSIFNIRNKIIHELDYEFDPSFLKARKRIQRKRDEMIIASEKILELTKTFILSACK
jgi:hypothetical protein